MWPLRKLRKKRKRLGTLSRVSSLGLAERAEKLFRKSKVLEPFPVPGYAPVRRDAAKIFRRSAFAATVILISILVVVGVYTLFRFQSRNTKSLRQVSSGTVDVGDVGPIPKTVDRTDSARLIGKPIPRPPNGLDSLALEARALKKRVQEMK